MNEQLSLFGGSSIEDIAQIICDEFNKVPSVWKGSFKVKEVALCRWYHIDDPNKVLEITLKPELNGNYLTQFAGDKESQRNIYNANMFSPLLQRLEKDNDFAVCVTPWNIYIYYHKYERKNLSWMM